MIEEAELRAAGDRIEALLSELTASDPDLTARVQELTRLLSQMYGAGLARILELLRAEGEAGAPLLERLVDDDLVASLLLVHDLHPRDTVQRIEAALADVRPYLGSHGGDVEVVGVEGDAVTLRMLGSCDGCPSSAVTLELAVETAIRAAAPEIDRIEVEAAAPAESAPGGNGNGTLIPAEALLRRPSSASEPAPASRAAKSSGNGAVEGAVEWCPLEGATDVPTGVAAGVELSGWDLVICRTDAGLYAYRDRCPRCSGEMARGPMGGPELVCGACGARFAVESAGAPPDGQGAPLEPVPLLVRDGVAEVALVVGPVASPVPG